MATADLVVIIGSAVLGLGQLWAFLAPKTLGPRVGSRAQEICVVVKSGFHPDVIPVEAGRPVRLLFYRDETAERSDRVIFDRPQMSQRLATFKTTAVEFIPEESGDYPFRCGATRGLVAAQVGGEAARLNIGKAHVNHG